MKRTDFTPCLMCAEGVAHAGGMLFYAVTLQRMAFDLLAVRQTDGLERILGSPRLADVFAPNNELAVPAGAPTKFLLCDECAMRSFPIAAMEEVAADRRASDAGVESSTSDASTTTESREFTE